MLKFIIIIIYNHNEIPDNLIAESHFVSIVAIDYNHWHTHYGLRHSRYFVAVAKELNFRRRTAEEREQAIRGVAGFTEVGRARDRKMVDSLRDRGVIRRPEDLNIDPLNANRQLLAARSIKDLVSWSGGLYR